MRGAPVAEDGVNRLADQQSPYLRAHARDPVDWYPWGAEAFERARELGRPVLVSIGYDSCHWCHVMQRESFRDGETAAQLNERFVAVKVDRELRPDVDHLYMTYTVLSTGHGGWPMTVIMTPDGAPFFAGTYFPKAAVPGIPAFADVLRVAARAYADEPARVQAVARDALDLMASAMRPQSAGPVGEGLVREASDALLSLEDRVNGGIGRAPKFPQAPAALFLLAHAEASGSEATLGMARRWVLAMLRSGMYDQVGGGSFRYSTDAEWLVPHFEKMLYDNALLLSTIAGLYRLEPSDELARYARATAAFLDRDVAAPGGGYHSSLDAETEGVEGGTYVWTWRELSEVLGPDGLDLAARLLGATEEGTWEGANVITRRGGRDRDADAVDDALARLFEVRQRRPQPKTITNVLVGWNSLAARGLIEAGRAIGDDALVDQGLRIVCWLRRQAITDRRVVHAVGDPSTADLELVDDYAAAIMALVSAAESDRDALERHQLAGAELRVEATRLLERALELFREDDVVFMTDERTSLVLRPVSYDDAPTPSGAATLAEAYRRLRPADREGLLRLVAPAAGLAGSAPHMSGAWLRVMVGA